MSPALRVVAPLLAVLLALPALGRPLVRPDPEGPGLLLSRLPPVLDVEDLQETLHSGLTTTVVLRLRERPDSREDSPTDAAATVEIRWEPWDEVFHVAALDRSGWRRLELADLGALRRWWGSLELGFDPGASAPGSRGTRGPPRSGDSRLEILVLPFSAAEGADAERWFSQSLEEGGKTGSERIGRRLDREPGVVGRTLGLLLATSLERKAIARHVFAVDLRGGREEDR